MYNLNAIMKKAWAIFTARRVTGLTFAEALRAAWAIAKGFTHAFQVSYVDALRQVYRTIGFGVGYDATRTRRIVQEHTYIATGCRPIGSNEFSLGVY